MNCESRSETRPPRRALLLAGFIAFSTSACIQPPTVDLHDVRFTGIGLRGATLLAELNIDNPNRFALEADSISFELQASHPGERETWTRVTSGTHTARVRVDGKSSTTVVIPIELAYSGLGTPLRALLDRGRFDYRITGEVFVRRPLPRAVPFGDEGSLSWLQSGER